MNGLPITSLYAALLGILLLILSWGVVSIRRSKEVSLGDAGHDDLRIAQDYAWFLMILFGREAVYLPDVYLHYRRRPGQLTGDGSRENPRSMVALSPLPRRQVAR